jgi:hypothetical protein
MPPACWRDGPADRRRPSRRRHRRRRRRFAVGSTLRAMHRSSSCPAKHEARPRAVRRPSRTHRSTELELLTRKRQSSSSRGALATTASAEARRAKAEAIQLFALPLDCFASSGAHSRDPLARNDVEGLELSPCGLNRNPCVLRIAPEFVMPGPWSRASTSSLALKTWMAGTRSPAMTNEHKTTRKGGIPSGSLEVREV